MPVALLIGGNTASSGEGIVVAFQGRPNTRTFGGATAGLATVNQSVALSDSVQIVVTAGYYRDRRGREYRGAPIRPDQYTGGLEETEWPSPTDATAWTARRWLAGEIARSRAVCPTTGTAAR